MTIRLRHIRHTHAGEMTTDLRWTFEEPWTCWAGVAAVHVWSWHAGDPCSWGNDPDTIENSSDATGHTITQTHALNGQTALNQSRPGKSHTRVIKLYECRHILSIESGQKNALNLFSRVQKTWRNITSLMFDINSHYLNQWHSESEEIFSLSSAWADI